MQSYNLISSEFETLDNVLSNNLEQPLILGYSHTRFDKSLDILNYANKLSSTKPKEATIDTFFIRFSIVLFMNKFFRVIESKISVMI